MISKTTRRFREAFGRRPEHVQRRAREAYRRFKMDPSHPSLRFKRVRTTRPIYSARIGLDYRALAVVDGDAVIWFWIGSHADCDQLLRTLWHPGEWHQGMSEPFVGSPTSFRA